jgi:hypothetical protein
MELVGAGVNILGVSIRLAVGASELVVGPIIGPLLELIVGLEVDVRVMGASMDLAGADVKVATASVDLVGPTVGERVVGLLVGLDVRPTFSKLGLSMRPTVGPVLGEREVNASVKLDGANMIAVGPIVGPLVGSVVGTSVGGFVGAFVGGLRELSICLIEATNSPVSILTVATSTGTRMRFPIISGASP